MALVFPRAMPLVGPSSQYFEIERFDALSPTSDGRVDGVTMGAPRWTARWTLSEKLMLAQSDEWRAFVDSLRGAQRTFLARDYDRPYPRSTPNGFGGLSRAGGGAFDGSAASWSVNADRDTPTLSGLSAGLVLSPTDYVMWRWTSGGIQRRSLHRVIEPAAATGSGVVAVAGEPPLPTLIPSDAVADLNRPECVMKLDVSQTKLGERTRAGRVGGVIAGVQDLRA